MIDGIIGQPHEADKREIGHRLEAAHGHPRLYDMPSTVSKLDRDAGGPECAQVVIADFRNEYIHLDLGVPVDAQHAAAVRVTD